MSSSSKESQKSVEAVSEEELLSLILDQVSQSEGYFFKYISANDVGTTGSHQSGFYMPRQSWPLFFDCPGEPGENRDTEITLRWPQFATNTDSRYIWYGKKKSEYRLTKGFHFLGDENVGDLLLFLRIGVDRYFAWLLCHDSLIDDFLDTLQLSPEDVCKVRFRGGAQRDPASRQSELIAERCSDWLLGNRSDFPSSEELSQRARELVSVIRRELRRSDSDADTLLLEYLETEFTIFRLIEESRYQNWLAERFTSVDQLVQAAATILNRRKTRAGHSLESHLRHIFIEHNVSFAWQEVSEDRKRPDFLFPGGGAYQNRHFPAERLRFLGVKTTCKDRWRQILNEANRIECKHLFTLQQGVSENQLHEMYEAGVILVVPRKYKKEFPAAFMHRILSLSEFIEQETVTSPQLSLF